MLPFKKGGFIMAIKAGAPIVPVAIQGGRAAMQRGSIVVQPVTVSMKLATPVSWGIKATGGREPFAYSASTLPAGVTLNPDGTVTGTPTRAGAASSPTARPARTRCPW